MPTIARKHKQRTIYECHRRCCQYGFNILNGEAASPLSYGLPNLTFTQFTGFNEQQPSFQTDQSVGLSESSSWTHGKHNLRFGGDLKRVQLNIFGATDTTGTFIFTGFATAQPGSTTVNGTGTSGIATSGSAFADFLLERRRKRACRRLTRRAICARMCGMFLPRMTGGSLEA